MEVTMVLASIAPNAERTDGTISPTIMARAGTGGGQLPIIVAKKDEMDWTMESSQANAGIMKNGCCTLNASHEQPIYIRLQEGNNAMMNNGTEAMEEVQAGERKMMTAQVVRRLTPLECTRLQGFPDGWVDIGDWIDDKGKVRKEADSPKYKALGNSIALPYWKVLLKRISAQYDRDATLGSLFSGIGGFDLCWSQINGPENVRWSSEIEPFPIAVMKKHFGDEDTGEPGDYYEAIQGSHKKC